MRPEGITEEEFVYNQIGDELLLNFYDRFNELLCDFATTVRQKGKLEASLPIVARIAIRVDQRKDYYGYYHSTKDNVMHMSHEKEMALWAYWVCKYKPVRFSKLKDEELFFTVNGCTISDAFAAYIIIAIVCANNKKRAKYFTPKVVKGLYYELANREFSKEAIITMVENLIQ